MTPTQTNPLLPLVLRLQECPTQDDRFSNEFVGRCWECLNEVWKAGATPIPAVIAALIIHDYNFAQLLTEAERAQMLALSKLALERFAATSNPPNKLGKALAAILEIST